MAPPTRQEVRESFGRMAEAALVGTGNPFQAVYDYADESFAQNKETPVLTLGATGTLRERVTLQGSRPTYFITAFIFVLRGETGTATYGQAEADDALDACEAAVAEIIDDNQRGTEWKAIHYDGRSTVDPVVIGGEQYWMEPVPLRFEVM